MAMDWKLALHTWTIDTTGLAGSLNAARDAGYDAVELRRGDLVQCFDSGQSRNDVIALIKESGIATGILGTEYGWFFAEGEEQQRLFRVLQETCEIAVALGCEIIMSAPGQLTGTLQQAAEATRIAGDIVGRFGLRLALEFNSQHPVVNSTASLREIIDQAGHAHCGMLLDAYHLHRSQGIATGLADVLAEELFAFQYSDVPQTPSIGVRRPIDRLPPGDGVVDWLELFGRLEEIGFKGYLSYEAPNPAQWIRSPYDVAREGLDKTKTLLASRQPAHARSTSLNINERS